MSYTPPTVAPDATTSIKGIIQLTGDLGGASGSPTVPGLAAKAPLASPAFTGTPTGIAKTHVGLANVDNTSDASKPVSAATQTALNERLVWRGVFANSTAYSVNDIVTANGATYRCRTVHTSGPSGTIPVDGDPTYWERTATVSASSIASIDDLPLSVPGTVTWNGSSWPARTTATSQTTRRIFYVGNPGGAGPTDMQENDIWIQG